MTRYPILVKKWLLMTVLKTLMAITIKTEASPPAVQQGLHYTGTITFILTKWISWSLGSRRAFLPSRYIQRKSCGAVAAAALNLCNTNQTPCSSQSFLSDLSQAHHSAARWLTHPLQNSKAFSSTHSTMKINTSHWKKNHQPKTVKCLCTVIM